jgi:heme exporter protein CcmD
LCRPRARQGSRDVSDFFAMHGYGFYVWSAYGVAALALAVELYALRARRRAVLEEARLTQPDTSAIPGAATQ